MSRRIAVCAVSLFVLGAALIPSASFAQAAPASLVGSGPLGWLSSLWEQVLERIVPLSEAGIQIDGNGLATQLTAEAGIQIDGNGINAEAGIQIDGNGRTAPTNDY